jgi:hypothetical protein
MAGAPADREPPSRERAPDKPPPPLALEDPTLDEQDRETLDPGPAEEIPARLVVVAYVLALVCALAPLAVLGAGFAGAVLFRRGRRGAGLGVIAVAVLCAGFGSFLLR